MNTLDINIVSIVSMHAVAIIVFITSLKLTRFGFGLNSLFIAVLVSTLVLSDKIEILEGIILFVCPQLLVNIFLFVYLKSDDSVKVDEKYKVKFKLNSGSFSIGNVRRGTSVIGSAGSGKTASIVFGFLKHFSKYGFSGVIHDYKHFELTEIAYPLFEAFGTAFHIVSFDRIYERVNPIAPRYLPHEESVNEIARVLIENLLEQKESGTSGGSKFFNDAAEGLIAGLIWKLKTSYPSFCTLPHLIAIYQYLDTDSLVAFLETNDVSRGMANAFISGKDSDRQTAGVKSTLANALKKISSQRIFMALSADEVPLNINTQERPTVISVVNDPRYETAYSPVIATIVHTITKQMSVRNANSSFLLMEEAPTIRLLNMHRIPATLRSYDISTIYVMQDKIQNDMLYGEKASRAILSNLSYQFFGKVNDPDTAKYYERFFELIKNPTRSVSKAANIFKSDTRITKGEKEVSKRRADIFFRLRPGEFVTFADGRDRKVRFTENKAQHHLPKKLKEYGEDDLRANFERVCEEVRSIFG